MTDSVAALISRYGLPPGAGEQLERLLELLVAEPLAPTSIRTRQTALDDHLADSLVALECEPLAQARRVLDLGSGAGLPGLPLAVALPEASFTLLESAMRKVRFIEQTVDVCRLSNVEVVRARAESFTSGRDGYEIVTARAVAPLPVVLEYAAPLLSVGGSLIVWRGRREPEGEAAARGAAEELGLGDPSVCPVQPYPGAEHRHLYVISKMAETPVRFPRRPGAALKRPLGTSPPTRASSDRERR